MEVLAPVSGKPLVSVIIPARNEEASLAACLGSLVSQTGLLFEVIVVDDGSTDRTREIAASFPTVRIITAPPLPSGWSGKNNAVAAGAQQARGEWWLFTDADTVHLPGSLSRSVTEARQAKAALLSYSPQQEVHGMLEKAVMPVIFAELAATYRPSLVSDPRSSAAAANGQYLLISREAYEAVGGHTAIAGSLLEDVALARNVKKSGRRIVFRYGADAVRTRMYRSFSQLREGWTKNLALLFASPVRLAVLRLLEFLLIVGITACGAAEIAGGRLRVGGFAATAATALYVTFLRRIRRAHFSWDASLLALLGLPIFSYLLLRSVLSYKRGGVRWKGRQYAADRKTEIPVPPILLTGQALKNRPDASATLTQGQSWSI
jgi:glycosyltransferase involved in cell wall biosynthesis